MSEARLTPEQIAEQVSEIYSHNGFMQCCGIKILHIGCGTATVGLQVEEWRHSNLNGKLHGGLLLTLADNATGIAAASIGKRVVTVALSVQFISSCPVGHFAEATARVIGNKDGKVNLTIEVKDRDTGKLAALGTAGMLTIAVFPGIPEKW